MLIAFNKPFGVLSQFTSEGGHPSLAEFIRIKNIYPAGRLDHDSEGLLLLSDDGKQIEQIASPRFKWPKTYCVQVDGNVTPEAIQQLARGVALKDGMSLPAEVVAIAEPTWLWPRTPAIRVRQNIPTTWIELSIREGRNRQVRRMCAAVGFPTLRLIRTQIGAIGLAGLAPGQWRECIAAVDF
jgi:23S rRNA pseudouridine2457 synthase